MPPQFIADAATREAAGTRDEDHTVGSHHRDGAATACACWSGSAVPQRCTQRRRERCKRCEAEESHHCSSFRLAVLSYAVVSKQKMLESKCAAQRRGCSRAAA